MLRYHTKAEGCDAHARGARSAHALRCGGSQQASCTLLCQTHSVRDVIYDDCCGGASVVHRREGVVALLACERERERESQRVRIRESRHEQSNSRQAGSKRCQPDTIQQILKQQRGAAHNLDAAGKCAAAASPTLSGRSEGNGAESASNELRQSAGQYHAPMLPSCSPAVSQISNLTMASLS